MITHESILQFAKSYEGLYKALWVYTHLKLTNKTIMDMRYSMTNKDGVVTFIIEYDYYSKSLNRMTNVKKVLFNDFKEWYDDFNIKH